MTNLQAIAQDLSSNDYDYKEIFEIVKEAYELGKANAGGQEHTQP